ncbi:hypothetical protein PAPYR_3698 [Paratrimastix pyriformis]|uniref:Uncharacterized protein n=1 Tax=Paratrimastix pyriformis TaxID=342808 RepID=A0ABQ8UQI1_9EUKA|nr:hypothetical protein PAPYR_3698 [Paratrimastix pyriformis]
MRWLGLFLFVAVCLGASPIAYEEVSMTIATYDGFQLPAILTVPKSQHPSHIAAVFIHGSGPQDYDGTASVTVPSISPPYYQTLTFKPFRDLAHALAEAGFPSLRYEKRSRYCGLHWAECNVTGGLVERLTLPDFEKDAAVAARYLLVGKMPAGTFVNTVAAIGHSEGCLLAPRVAAAVPGVRYVVNLHGAYTPFPGVLLDQLDAGLVKINDAINYVLTLDQSTAAVQKSLAALRQQANTVRLPAPTPPPSCGPPLRPAALCLGVRSPPILILWSWRRPCPGVGGQSAEARSRCKAFFDEYLATGGRPSKATTDLAPALCTNTEITTMVDDSEWVNITNAFYKAAAANLELHVMLVNGPSDWNIPPQHYTAMHRWLAAAGFGNPIFYARAVEIPTSPTGWSAAATSPARPPARPPARLSTLGTTLALPAPS